MKFYKYDSISDIPSEALVAGNEFKIREGSADNYIWRQYKVAADGKIYPVRGTTAEEDGRLKQMDQPFINKVKNDIYTKTEVDSKDAAINNRIDGINIGVNGSVTTTQTLAQLNALTDGVYEAQTSGSYANGLTADVGYVTRFKKTGTVWTIHSRTAINATGKPILNPTGSDIPNEKAVADYVQPAVSSFIISENILDKSQFVFGYYKADGIVSASTATIRTPKYTIPSGKTHLSVNPVFPIGEAVLYRLFFYNVAGTLLPDPDGRIARSVTSLEGVVIPSGAVSWSMNIVTEQGLSSATDNKYSNALMASYTQTNLPYQPYGYRLDPKLTKSLDDKITEQSEDIQEISNEVKEVLVPSKNLIDKSKIVYGYYNTSGAHVSSTTSIRTPKILLDPVERKLSGNQNPPLGVTNKVNFYDSLGTVVKVVLTTDSLQGIDIPLTATHFSVNVTSQLGGVGDPTDNQYVNSLQFEYGEASTAFVPFGNKINENLLPSDIADVNKSVSITVVSLDAFYITVYYDNGKTAKHHWVKNNKAPQYDTAWRATEIEVDGANIAQGQFNWIHMTAFPNEGQHVGTGHGCETMLRTKFYIDGKEVVLADNIGETISGTVFHFDIATVIYAADSAETIANWNGANVVPQLPLIESTKHYMIGEIRKNGFTANYNKLVPLRNGTQFGRCYGAMQNAYRTHFDRLEIRNIENTMNDIQTLTPIGDSTASLQGLTYDTVEGWRGELAQEAIAYSDRFNYVLKTRIFAKTEKQRLQTTIQVEPTTSKCYFHPVITTSLASLRGLTVDTFNRGDVIECYVERELHI